MKILELNTFAGAGSTGRIALDIALLGTQQGSDTIIGFGAGSVPPEAEVYALRIGGRAGRKWHGALRKLLDAEGYGSILATRRLIAFLKTWQPDVVHLHNIHGCYLNHRLLFRWLKKTGVPVVWTLHDCWPFTGHCAYFDYVACDRWQTACHHCPQLRSYPVCIGLDGSARNHRRRKALFTSLSNLTLVTPCEWLKGLLAHSFLRDVPARVIYNGVDRTVFYPRQSDLRAQHGITQPYLALCVASEWELRKGAALLPALAQALGADCKLAVIGLTQAQIAALPEGIVGLPRTASARELAKWYTAADCFINPTLEDNMPLVNLEALACGTPVAVFETGGCPECVTEACGAVAPKGDVPALAAAARKLCVRKAELQAACLAQAERFDSVAAARAYDALYREVRG
jgi:glycosyltransferase involved in cell wall biosynthesis